MTLILAFIAAHMGFLWDGARYHISGSEVANSNGGDAVLIVESEELRLRFVCDRGQLFLDFQPAFSGAESVWISVDLVRRFHTGQREVTAELDESYVVFIRKDLSRIEHEFGPDEWPSTLRELKGLRARRAKELFG